MSWKLIRKVDGNNLNLGLLELQNMHLKHFFKLVKFLI